MDKLGLPLAEDKPPFIPFGVRRWWRDQRLKAGQGLTEASTSRAKGRGLMISEWRSVVMWLSNRKSMMPVSYHTALVITSRAKP